MKKCISFFILCMVFEQTIFSALQGLKLLRQPNTNQVQQQKPVLQIFKKGNFDSEQERLSLTPRKKVQTPRAFLTPRSILEYYLPYIFDGTIQKFFLKKRLGFDIKKPEKGTETVFLIPINEKENFESKMQDFLNFFEELNAAGVFVSAYCEKIKDIPEKDFGEYILYTIGNPLDEQVLSEDSLKYIKSIQKKALFIPLFYQIVDESINVLIKNDPSAKNEPGLRVLIPRKDDLAENGSEKKIQGKIENIVKKKFKVKDFGFLFKPLIISKTETQIFFMQVIDLVSTDAYDISESKEYIIQPIQKILKATDQASTNILEMKKYLKYLYKTLTSNKYEYDKEKIDANFVELFLKEYTKHEKDMKKLKENKIADEERKERLAEEKKEALQKKQTEAQKKEEERLKKLEAQRINTPRLSSEEQAQNVRVSEVIQKENEERARKKEELEAKLKSREVELKEESKSGKKPALTRTLSQESVVKKVFPALKRSKSSTNLTSTSAKPSQKLSEEEGIIKKEVEQGQSQPEELKLKSDKAEPLVSESPETNIPKPPLLEEIKQESLAQEKRQITDPNVVEEVIIPEKMEIKTEIQSKRPFPSESKPNAWDNFVNGWNNFWNWVGSLFVSFGSWIANLF